MHKTPTRDGRAQEIENYTESLSVKMKSPVGEG